MESEGGGVGSVGGGEEVGVPTVEYDLIVLIIEVSCIEGVDRGEWDGIAGGLERD